MLIGLVGTKGVGKDTVADHLVAKYNFCKLAFADPLKDVCQVLFGLDQEHFTSPTMKEQIVPMWGQSPRQMMQQVGTDIVRKHLGEDFWIRRLDSRIVPGQHTVVSDVRFLHEADYIRTHSGVLVRVYSDKDKEQDEHISEKEQDMILTDFDIMNSHTVDDGREKLYAAIEELLVTRIMKAVKQPS